MTKPKTSRRAVLAGLAAAPVAGLPALALPDEAEDPIFAAIERHKAAWTGYSEACDLTDAAARKEKGETVSEADRAAHAAAEAAWREAEDELVDTEPQTMAGARAALEYLVEFDEDEPDASWRFLPALLASPIFEA